MNQPGVFISCVSSEFRTTRSRVATILTRLGYTPVFEEIFGTEPGDLRQVLREKIDGCKGVIQIVGQGYGAEPPAVDEDFGRVSYTQFEFLYGRLQLVNGIILCILRRLVLRHLLLGLGHFLAGLFKILHRRSHLLNTVWIRNLRIVAATTWWASTTWRAAATWATTGPVLLTLVLHF